ncbi:hypothetical protein [Legionella shakespearei]|uniref:Uncharacterized protein n=1 Tax=Legionella shakespearei DSM 23087 TaxID=1122169 RepID=A0A0W0Z911_9GAMM|nr:hypothetical protein [Legionella shakespearei]KTD65629.1 hypothetical protein Lsha_0238 [Legionella shakespearei DSM 23087]
MKYLVSCLLAIPLLSSCTVVEEQYYDPGYYPPPPPRVEVHPIQPPRQFNNYHGHHQNNNGYRPAPGRRVYQGHPNNGAPVVVNPRPQAHGNASPNVHGHPGTNTGNVHGHPGTGNVHGHTNSNGTVHGHGGNTGSAVVVQPQASTAPAQPQPNATGHAPQQVTVHGHG